MDIEWDHRDPQENWLPCFSSGLLPTSIFLALSSINFSIIASEKSSTTPSPTSPFSSTLYKYSINISFSALPCCPMNA
jgi:hypothetical protein